MGVKRNSEQYPVRAWRCAGDRWRSCSLFANLRTPQEECLGGVCRLPCQQVYRMIPVDPSIGRWYAPTSIGAPEGRGECNPRRNQPQRGKLLCFYLSRCQRWLCPPARLSLQYLSWNMTTNVMPGKGERKLSRGYRDTTGHLSSVPEICSTVRELEHWFP